MCSLRTKVIRDCVNLAGRMVALPLFTGSRRSKRPAMRTRHFGVMHRASVAWPELAQRTRIITQPNC